MSPATQTFQRNKSLPADEFGCRRGSPTSQDALADEVPRNQCPTLAEPAPRSPSLEDPRQRAPQGPAVLWVPPAPGWGRDQAARPSSTVGGRRGDTDGGPTFLLSSAPGPGSPRPLPPLHSVGSKAETHSVPTAAQVTVLVTVTSGHGTVSRRSSIQKGLAG